MEKQNLNGGVPKGLQGPSGTPPKFKNYTQPLPPPPPKIELKNFFDLRPVNRVLSFEAFFFLLIR